MLRIREFIRAGLAALRSSRWRGEVRYDETTHTYHNTPVYRGFPLGSIGNGGFGVGTAGGFQDLRINNNWMRPIRHVKGAFWAASCAAPGQPRQSRILRRAPSAGEEYTNATAIKDVEFMGRVPGFTQGFRDDWPLEIDVEGFSPLTPQDAKDASLPAAHFTVTLRNTSDEPLDASFLFSWENVLGRGGTGQTGVKLWHGLMTRLKGKLRYDHTRGNYQVPISLDGLVGIDFATTQTWPEKSHRQSVLGRYLLLGETSESSESNDTDNAITWTRQLAWDSHHHSAEVYETFARKGQLAALATSATIGGTMAREHCAVLKQPAAALCAQVSLAPQASQDIRFVFVWWTPGHTTEKDAWARAKTQEHQGVRVGHYYENYFDTPEAIASYVWHGHQRLHKESTALHKLLDASDLPAWLKHALPNAADSVICNTVLPKDGTLHTIEGTDWPWYFGGLCGTNDQRISSQPYTSLFFTDLDKSEVDAFRKELRDGAIPHGIGNCDLALSDADVPYGWPVRILGGLGEVDWPDLTLSAILQIIRHYRIAADEAWLERAWPDLWAMFEALKKSCRHGVPEGGSTYDTYSFPGTFLYTGTLMLAALDAMIPLSQARSPEDTEGLQDWHQMVAERLQDALWHDAGGYYRAAEGKDSLFLGGLAGDWFARYMGLSPVLPPAQVRNHLRHQQRVLIEPHPGRHAPAAYPDTEARFDGQPVATRVMGMQVYGYAWQVISYHGCEAIYANLVKEGLDAIHLLYDRMYHGGWPWSADLYGNPGAVYMTHPVLWAVPQALTGAALDLPARTLRLSPRNLPGHTEQAIPFFFPNFWAMLHSKPARDQAHKACLELTLELHNHFGAPVTIDRIITTDLDDSAHTHTPETPWEMSTGKRFQWLAPWSED